MSYGAIVLANTKTGLIPSIIRFITRSKWSHSLILLPDMLEAPLGLEAAESGVDVIRFDVGYRYNSSQSYRVYEVLVDQATMDAALRLCLCKLESPYAKLKLPWFIWRAINSLFGRDIRSQNNWAAKMTGEFCSELCEFYLAECGLEHLFEGYGIGSVNAQDLYEIVMKNPNIFRLVEQKD